MKKMVWLIRIGIVTAAAVAGAAWWHAYQEKSRLKSASELTLYGNVEIRRVNLGFRTPGRIEQFAFEEGDRVRRGDRIAVLDRKPALTRLASAKARLDSVSAILERLENGFRPQEINQARAKVDELRASLAFAEADYERNEQLVRTGGASASDFDKSLSVRDELKAKIVQAEENLRLMEEGYRHEDIAAARAQKAQAEAERAEAEIALADTELISPSDGVLLNRVEEVGAVIQNGQTIAILSLDTDVWVYVYVDEPDLGKLEPGRTVRIRTDSSEKVYTGQIGYISPEAEFTPKNVETEKLRTDLVYRVRIIAESPDQGLRQGMPVTVTIPIGGTDGTPGAAEPRGETEPEPTAGGAANGENAANEFHEE